DWYKEPAHYRSRAQLERRAHGPCATHHRAQRHTGRAADAGTHPSEREPRPQRSPHLQPRAEPIPVGLAHPLRAAHAHP
ncbi:hypothetical protein, partial [Rothia kristinae]|uniref:hypothetical protein n=1 Tax=Rothia kristinae TaxID=37923 RepID=UPI001AD7E66B